MSKGGQPLFHRAPPKSGGPISARYYLLDALARRWPARRGAGDALVVYSPGHLGDMLQTVPMMRRLRREWPGRKIVWLVAPWSETLARRYEKFSDDICVFTPMQNVLLRNYARGRQGLWRQWKILMDLRRHGVEDLISTLPVNSIARFVANALLPKRWIGVDDRRPPRVHPLIRTEFFPYEKARHEAEFLLGMLKPMGVVSEEEDAALSYEVTDAERNEAAAFLKAEGVREDRPLVLVAPGSGWNGKNWPAVRFGEVAARLTREGRVQVAWTGGTGEAGLFPASRQGHDFDWMGRLSLSLLAAVMERAALWVGNDSGPMHLAAAIGCPTVSLWGPTDPRKWGPHGEIHRAIRKRERCPDCIYGYRQMCEKPNHDCMTAIDVDEVAALCAAVLRGEGGTR